MLVKKEMDIGSEHLEGALRAALIARRAATADRKHLSAQRELLGTSLSAIFQVATCYRKCFGGSHIIESLSGRVYNHAVSAYLVAASGFYDEVLNLTRSIGEISNLIALSHVDGASFVEWLSSDEKTRRKKYSPSKIRDLVRQKDERLLFATTEWYSELCEKYTHATPTTRPNVHSETSTANAGGVYEVSEFERVLDELVQIVCCVALMVSKHAELDDMIELIQHAIKSIRLESSKT